MAEIDALRAANEQLSAQVAHAQAETARAWDAEAELRRYVDDTLMPWMAAAQAAAAPTAAPIEVAVDVAAPSLEEDVVHVDVIEAVLEVEDLEDFEEVAADEDVAVEFVPVAEEPAEVPAEEAAAAAAFEPADEHAVEPADEPAEIIEPVSWSLSQEDEIAEPVPAEPAADINEPESNEPEAIGVPVSMLTPSEPDSWDDAPSVSLEAVPASATVAGPVGPSVSARLASSPEVAAMGDDIDFDDLASPSELEEVAPRAAGAPLPRLLASSPEAAALESEG
jgi:hypothetical protein